MGRRADPRLADLDSDDRRIAELAEEQAEVLAVLADEAAQLSNLRAAAAAALSEAVTAELHGLAMPDAELSVRLTGTQIPTGSARRTRWPSARTAWMRWNSCCARIAAHSLRRSGSVRRAASCPASCWP